MLNRSTIKLLIFALAALIQSTPIWGGERTDLADKPVELARFGVVFHGPRDWYTPDPDVILDNLRKLDSEKENLREILASHGRSMVIATYLKHDPRRHQGMVPTINVLGIASSHKTFDHFRAMIAASARSIGSVLQNYVVKTEPTERILAGRRVVFFVAEYDISTRDGVTRRVSGTTYAIPCGEIFLQVSMSESLPVKHSELFASFINSFTFKKPGQAL